MNAYHMFSVRWINTDSVDFPVSGYEAKHYVISEILDKLKQIVGFFTRYYIHNQDNKMPAHLLG